VRDVDLEVSAGAFVGIIGANGSGKSTLLRLLAGIVRPTRGSLSVHGRVAALMETGVGFHPDLTGWENAFLYGSLLGLRRQDIRARLGDIAGFSGLESRFLDMPLKYYSSGMQARLGFAVAAHCDPDVLLLDEIMAVGDTEFQSRSYDRIRQMHERGVTVLWVTHHLSLARVICQDIMWMSGGRLRARGAPADIVPAYRMEMTRRLLEGVRARGHRASDSGHAVRIEAVRLLGGDGAPAAGKPLRSGGTATVEVELRARHPVHEVQVVAYLLRDDAALCALFAGPAEGGVETAVSLVPGQRICLRLTLDPLSLRRGKYAVSIVVGEGWPGTEGEVLAVAVDAARFEVVDARPGDYYRQLIDAPHQWAALQEGPAP